MPKRLMRHRVFRAMSSDKPEQGGVTLMNRVIGFDPLTPTDDGMGGLQSMAGFRVLCEQTVQFVPGLHLELDGHENVATGAPASPASNSAFYGKTRLFALENASVKGTVIGTIECGNGVTDSEPGKMRSLYQELWGGAFPTAAQFLGPRIGYQG